MKTRLFFVLAAMGLLASCSKEKEIIPASSSEPVVLQVGIAPVTKTHMGGLEGDQRKIYWSDGDQIAINGQASDALGNLEEGTQTASFSFADAPAVPYKVLYPASAYVNENIISLPDIQKWEEGSFADDVVPMAGYSADGSNITVGYLCAVLKISVRRAASDPDEDNLLGVRFRGKNGEQVKGQFGIDYTTGQLSGASNSEDDKEVKVYHTLSTETPAVYYITVPAGTYAKGFEVVVQDVNNHTMTMTRNGSVNLVAGTIYNLAEFAYAPTGTETGIEIDSAEKLIAFATAYNNKEYASQGKYLIATLTDNISFDATSSAAFNATGGIGTSADVNRFDGTFNGNGMTISGLQSTVTLFGGTTSSSTIKDFTLDNTCSFTLTHPNTADTYMGAIVGYHRGVLDQVSVAADVTLNAGDVAYATALGGLVGRGVVGSVNACTYSGNITVPDGFVVNAKKVYVGGLVGYITNADGEVTDSDFEGTLDFAGTVASTDKTNPYLMIGGIVGSNAGTVSGCEVKGTNTKGIEMDNGTTYTATIQNHSRKAYHLAQGGIAGYNAGTISNCTNGASTKNFVLANATKGGTSDDANSRYYDVGGIVGLNAADATVTGCVNNGLFESRSTPRIQKIGGVAGYNLGTISSCSNSDTGDIVIASATGQSPYSLRVGEVGGAIGNNSGTVSDIQNAGDISLSRTENNAGVEMKFGGVIGVTTKEIDGGAGKSISNTGNISITYNPATVTTAGLRFGGVVGSAQASVRNVNNSGKVTYTLSASTVMSKLYMGGVAGEVRGMSEDPIDVVISGCENQGEVYFNVNSLNYKHTDNYAGGILGKSFNCNVMVSNCTNAGYIHGGNKISNNKGTTFYVGGIAAYLDGASSISNCENTGVLVNDQFNNTITKVGSTFQGGIAGFVQGTETARITISTVTSNVASGATITGGRRGYTGGAVGYGEYVDITNATSTNSYGGGSGYYYGGIAGWIVNSTVTGSTYSGTAIESTQVQGAGGIVCVLDAGSVIDGCSSYLNSITHGANACVDGDIAAKSVAGSTIKNSHYTGTYGICSDTNFTDGGGNAADL